MTQDNTLVVQGEPLVIERNYPFRIAIVNDIHAGSQYALFPGDEHRTRYGSGLTPNKKQKVLWSYFMDFAEECRDNKANILWIPGDIIMGQNRIEKGKFSVNIELGEQCMIAVEIIETFCEMVPTIQEVWLWQSTGYHGSLDSSVEEYVTSKLNERGMVNAKYFGEYSYVSLQHNGYEKTIFITHHASSATMYPEQAMGKDMMLWQEGVAKGKLPPVDIIIRAHKHFYAEVHKPTIRSIQLPCWQFLVPYSGSIKNFARWQPDVGGVILTFDHKMRTHTWPFIYPNFVDPSEYVTAIKPKGVRMTSLSRD